MIQKSIFPLVGCDVTASRLAKLLQSCIACFFPLQQHNACLHNRQCNTTRDTQSRKHRVTLSIRCPLRKEVNKMFVHPIQLQRKPEPKEVDISYGKKVKDISCRVKTAKEEWKEREASTTQTVPTRIKIFEGGSVRRLA